MSVATLNLVNPLAEAIAAPPPPSESADETPRGRRLGFLSNRKPNATEMEREFGRLAQQAGIADGSIKYYEKVEGPGVGASTDLLDQIAAECDVVMSGSADCGSCTSWSTHDAVELEKRGATAVLLCSAAFEPLAKAQSAALGRPNMQVLVVPHPIGGSSVDVAVGKARDAYPRLEEWFNEVTSAVAQPA